MSAGGVWVAGSLFLVAGCLFLVADCLFLVAGSLFLVVGGLLPDTQRTNSASRAQNRGFCAFLAFRTPVFGLFEHKIGVFVRFWPLEPPFSGFSSTKSAFLCAFWLRDPCFRAFRAQNRGFCALLGSGTLVFGRFEHKIEVFVRFWGLEPLFSGYSSTKSRFLCAFGVCNPHFRAFRVQNRDFCARAAGQVASGSEKVTFLQITEHTSKMQIPHNQIINF